MSDQAADSQAAEQGLVQLPDPAEHGIPPELTWPEAFPANLTNASDDLWTGPASIATGAGRFQAEARAHWQWLPFAVLLLELTTDEGWPKAKDQAPTDVTLDGAKLGMYRQWQLRGASSSTKVTRLLEVEELTVGDPQAAVGQVRFALPNFNNFLGRQVSYGKWMTRFGRFEASFGAWNVRLDAAPYRPHKHGEDWAGFATTHIGLLNKGDGTSFTLAEVAAPMQALRLMLSLLRGSFTSPVAWRGENLAGERAWLHLTNRWPVDVWPGQPGVMPQGYLQHESPEVEAGLSSALTRLLELLANPDWQAVLDRGLGWYVAANNGRHLGDLIIAQAGLELLAYAHLVLGGRMKAEGFDRLQANDQIRLLLATLQIETQVPSDLQNLAALAREQQLDGPEMVSRCRNATVHPPTTKQQQRWAGVELQDEARDLSLRYLELALLATVSYDGLVDDRIASGLSH